MMVVAGENAWPTSMQAAFNVNFYATKEYHSRQETRRSRIPTNRLPRYRGPSGRAVNELGWLLMRGDALEPPSPTASQKGTGGIVCAFGVAYRRIYSTPAANQCSSMTYWGLRGRECPLTQVDRRQGPGFLGRPNGKKDQREVWTDRRCQPSLIRRRSNPCLYVSGYLCRLCNPCPAWPDPPNSPTEDRGPWCCST